MATSGYGRSNGEKIGLAGLIGENVHSAGTVKPGEALRLVAQPDLGAEKLAGPTERYIVVAALIECGDQSISCRADSYGVRKSLAARGDSGKRCR